MKKVSGLIAALLICALLLAGCTGVSSQQTQQAASEPAASSTEAAPAEANASTAKEPEFVLKLGYGGATTNERHICATAYADWVFEQSGGRLKIDCYPSEMLGTDAEMAEMCSLGNLDMTLNSSGVVSVFVPGLDVMSLPFLFPDYESVDAFMDGEIGQSIVADMPETCNMRSLAYWENGFRQITNNVRPINTPDDLKGLKLRAPENAVYVETLRALGAEPSPFAFAELYLALSQGTFDGQENPIANIYASKFYEVQKYVAMVNYMYTPLMMIISEQTWQKLPADLQDILAEGAYKFALEHRQLVREHQDGMIEELKGFGMEFTYPDLEPFVAKVGSVYEMFRDRVGSDLLDTTLEYCSNYTKAG